MLVYVSGRPTGGRRCFVLFRFAPLPSSRESVFGTARSGQGRAGFAWRSEPLTARTVRKLEREGKGAGSQGRSPRGVRGSAPPGGLRAHAIPTALRRPTTMSGPRARRRKITGKLASASSNSSRRNSFKRRCNSAGLRDS